jgi:GDP-L-fucose synthase
MVDLEDSAATLEMVRRERPDLVIHAAAYVAGVAARAGLPADFLNRNLRIDDSVISASVTCDVPQLLYISSAGIYPTSAPQPITEEAFFSGPPESTLEPYAIAKIVGVKRCEYVSEQHGLAYRAIVPSNLYGPGEHVGGNKAHLIAAALEKVNRALKTGGPVEVWGDGTAKREFTYVGDLAGWIATLAGRVADLPPMLNVGSGDERTIREYYEIAAQVAGYTGSVVYDVSRPTGAMRRVLDSSRARALGWVPATDLKTGMELSYRALSEELARD